MADFEGFGEKALPFLKALGFHQSRDWFLENKTLYETEVRAPLIALVETLSQRFEAEGLPFRGARKTSLFRINRDVRFSKNKDPYNTHASAVLTRNATKKDQGLVYVHVSNERTWVAGGFYGMDPELLTAFRNQIVTREKDFLAVVGEIEALGLELGAHDDALKRPPKGFADAPEAVVDILKQRHFTVSKTLSDDLVTSPALVDAVVDHARTTLPLCNFGWRAIDPILAERAAA